MTKKQTTHCSFDSLPDSALVLTKQLVCRGEERDAAAPLPFTASTLRRLVKEGKFPAPARLSKRIHAWQAGTVRRWLAQQEVGAQ